MTSPMTTPQNLEGVIQRLRKRLDYDAGKARSQWVSPDETIVKKTDLRALIERLSSDTRND
jgi:hypothetical protein